MPRFSFPPLHILDVILSNMDDTEYGIKNSNIIDKVIKRGGGAGAGPLT